MDLALVRRGSSEDQSLIMDEDDEADGCDEGERSNDMSHHHSEMDGDDENSLSAKDLSQSAMVGGNAGGNQLVPFDHHHHRSQMVSGTGGSTEKSGKSFVCQRWVC